MEADLKRCEVCGAANRADAGWCARCLAPFEQVDDEGDAPYDGPDEDVYAAPRGRGMLRVIALLVAITFALSFGANSVITLLRDDEIPRRGLAGEGYRFIAVQSNGGPVRYDPCTPLHYVFNAEHAPPGADQDVARAAALVEGATGIDLVFDGVTDEPAKTNRPLVQPERYGQRWAPILIGWIPHDSAIFDVHSVAVGGSAYRANESGRLVYVTGDIILNGAENLASGFGAGRTWGKVLLHEWGHVLGLDHVPDPAQVMNADLVSSPAVWGTGDAAGLRQLGRLAGCVEEPLP